MSLRDLEQNRATLAAFKGRRCFLQLATNSIRFRMDDRAKKGCYIWIDPPWVFSRVWEEITSSDAYSADTFAEWCHLLTDVRETTLQDFVEGENGAVTFIFPEGYRLFVPADTEPEEEPDPDYDHWYAYDEKNA